MIAMMIVVVVDPHVIRWHVVFQCMYEVKGCVNGFDISLVLFTKLYAYSLCFNVFQVRNRKIRTRAECLTRHERGSI